MLNQWYQQMAMTHVSSVQFTNKFNLLRIISTSLQPDYPKTNMLDILYYLKLCTVWKIPDNVAEKLKKVY